MNTATMTCSRFIVQSSVVLACLGLCSALFYTNSKENDYPRIGKRLSLIIRGHHKRPPIDTDYILTDTEISDVFEKYPYVDVTEDDEQNMYPADKKVPDLEHRDVVKETSVERSPRQQNIPSKYFVYDDTDSDKLPLISRMGWPRQGSPVRRQRVWERYNS